MAQSVIIFSQLIPTILAIVGLYLMISGVLDDKKTFLTLGVLVFLLAVIIPFVILSAIL